MTTAIVKDMTLEEADASIRKIEKAIVMDRAMDSRIGIEIWDLDERGGWMRYENDDGTRRFKDVTACLIASIEAKLDIQPHQVKRYLRAATAELQLFGREIDGQRQLLVDPRLKRPALPERTVRELARLNDWPDKQKKAWERIMEITDGKPTAKVAQGVVDTFDGTYQKRKAARSLEVVQDPKQKKIALLLAGSMDDHIRLAEEKQAPKWVVDALYAARKKCEKWAELIKS